MSGERYYTTKIWRQPSLIGFSSAVALSTSMDRLGELVISTWKRPCKKIQNGSEFPELVAQNFRTPQLTNHGTLEFDFSSKNCELVPNFPRIGLLVTQSCYR